MDEQQQPQEQQYARESDNERPRFALYVLLVVVLIAVIAAVSLYWYTERKAKLLEQRGEETTPNSELDESLEKVVRGLERAEELYPIADIDKEQALLELLQAEENSPVTEEEVNEAMAVLEQAEGQDPVSQEDVEATVAEMETWGIDWREGPQAYNATQDDSENTANANVDVQTEVSESDIEEAMAQLAEWEAAGNAVSQEEIDRAVELLSNTN